MSSNDPDIRTKKIEAVKADLLKYGWPRFQITLILGVTALSAFLTSAILLKMDVTSMTLRYPIAVIVAYLVFLLLLKIWLIFQRGELDINLPDIEDIIPFGLGSSDGSGSNVAAKEFNFTGGGDFGGAGSGGDWDGDSVQSVGVPISPVGLSSASSHASMSSASGGSGGSFLDSFDLDIEGFLLIVVGVILLSAIVLVALYVIYIAPIMLAEIMLDGILAGSLYKTVKGLEKRHWLSTALRKTALPVFIIVVLSGFAGLCFEAAVPEAKTVGDVFRAVFADGPVDTTTDLYE